MSPCLVGMSRLQQREPSNKPHRFRPGWLRLPVASMLMTVLWATLYSVLPDGRQKFTFITPGSVAGCSFASRSTSPCVGGGNASKQRAGGPAPAWMNTDGLG